MAVLELSLVCLAPWFSIIGGKNKGCEQPSAIILTDKKPAIVVVYHQGGLGALLVLGSRHRNYPVDGVDGRDAGPQIHSHRLR